MRFSGLHEYEVPLFEGSEMTILDSYLLLYQYALKHSLTKLAFQEMIELVNVHLPGATITLINGKTAYLNNLITVKGYSLVYLQEFSSLVLRLEHKSTNFSVTTVWANRVIN